MLSLDISYKGSKGVEVFGPENVAKESIEDIFFQLRAIHIDVAREFLKENIRTGFFPEEFITIVDNVPNAPIEKVKVFGKTEFITKIENVSEAIEDIFRSVSERSPISSGYYSAMNILMYNGRVVAKGFRNASGWLNQERKYKKEDVFRIINLSPYARKLERLGIKRGTTGTSKGQITRKERKGKHKGLKVNVANGTYWLAKNSAKRKFPQLRKNINFVFIPVSPSIASRHNTKTFNTDYRFKLGAGRGRPYLYPSIKITINPSAFSSNAGLTESGDKL